MDKATTAYVRSMMNERGKTCVEQVLEYLHLSGIVGATTTLEKDQAEIEANLKTILGPIRTGDIIYTEQGLFLVTDDKPAAGNGDNKHVRAIKVMVDGLGKYRICSERRSTIVKTEGVFRIKASTFDMKRVEKCSYERYLAYKKIGEINTELAQMCEEEEKGV